MKNVSINPIKVWADQIDWNNRINRVCKPCWELKYCPYGILVEDFPLKKEGDQKSCRIYGHDCPVFSVNEPLTETRELRDVKRVPSRPTMLKAASYAKSVCQKCKENIKEEDIHFDHRIPWIKGGSSDLNNIVVLCSSCNLKKGKKFEEEFLVEGAEDHFDKTKKPVKEYGFAIGLLHSFIFLNSKLKESGTLPTKDQFKEHFQESDDEYVNKIYSIYGAIRDFINGTKMKKVSLRFRWGFTDGSTHSVKETVDKFGDEIGDYYDAEVNMFKHIGLVVRLSTKERKKWNNS